MKRLIVFLLMLPALAFGADGYVQLPPDSTGKKTRAIDQSIGGSTVYQQNMLISDPTTTWIATVNEDGSVNTRLKSSATVINTSTTPLANGASYTTPSFDSSLNGHGFTLAVTADQNGHTYHEQSIDNSTWFPADDFIYTANTGHDEEHIGHPRYNRFKFTNDSGSAQTTFTFSVIQRHMDGFGTVLPGIVETSTTPPTRGNGNRAALALDSDGKVYSRIFDWDPLFATSGLSTATALTQLIAAPGAGVSIYVTGWKCSSSAAATTTADQQCTIKYGTGTNCATGTTYIDGCFQIANGGCAESMTMPLKLPANNALCWIHAAAGSKIVRVNYFLAP